MDTPLRILVAEGDLGDAMLLRRLFERAEVKVPLHFARDGEEVIDYLQGKPPFTNPVQHPLPTLLLLDLKLPRLDGFEILRWLRLQPGLRHMVVVVFSSSAQPQDVERAYQLGANSYINKPQDPDELVRVVQEFQKYWLNINPRTEGESATPAFPTRVS